MDAERDTDGTTDAHEGDHTPADGAGTEGEGGKPDTRPGDKLATIRRTLWWIGLALQLPFALTLIHLCFVKFLWAVSAFLLVRLSGCF